MLDIHYLCQVRLIQRILGHGLCLFHSTSDYLRHLIMINFIFLLDLYIGSSWYLVIGIGLFDMFACLRLFAKLLFFGQGLI